MTIILRPDTPEIKFRQADSGIQLCLEAQSGDQYVIELGDEVVGYVIEQLLLYAWDTTIEDAFGCGTDDTVIPDVTDVPF